MRRMFVLAALAAALIPLAACGGDEGGGDPVTGNGGGTGSTGATGNGGGAGSEQVCDSLKESTAALAGEFQAALAALVAASAIGSEAALEAAVADLGASASEFAQVYRDHAVRAADAELSAALRAVGDEIDRLVASLTDIDSGGPPPLPDTDGYDAATTQVDHVCGW